VGRTGLSRANPLEGYRVPFLGPRLQEQMHFIAVAVTASRGREHQGVSPMRTYVLAAITAAAFILPTAAFSAEVDVGPGGVRIGTGHYHHHDRYEGGGPRYYNRYEGDHFRSGPRPYRRDYD
jgi:hypothetical protein